MLTVPSDRKQRHQSSTAEDPTVSGAIDGSGSIAIALPRKEQTMVFFGKTFKTGLVATLLLAGLTSGAQGQVAVGGGLSSFGGESRGVIQITGKVVCTGCSLDEVSKAQPNLHHLHQLTHRHGQLVMEVQTVNDSQRWSTLTWPPRLWVRANDQILQKLGAEENLFKEVELTGLLNNSRTLDVFDLTVRS